MMFSTKAEYGVRVMVGLARRAVETPEGTEAVVPLAEIAEHDGLPLAYLEHLVARGGSRLPIGAFTRLPDLDDETVALMARANVRWVFIGLDSDSCRPD